MGGGSSKQAKSTEQLSVVPRIEASVVSAGEDEMRAHIAAMEAKMKKMEAQAEAANKVMDTNEAQQLTSHLAALQRQQTTSQGGKFTMDLAFGTSKDALNLAVFLGMSEEYARTVNANGELMMQQEIERLQKEGKLPGDPWNYFSLSRGEVLEHWNYVVNETSSEKDYPNGTRDQGRSPTNLDGFMQCPEVAKAKLSRAQVIALRLYTTLIYKYVNAPLRDKQYFRTVSDQPAPRHPLAAVVWYIFTGLKQLRDVADMKQGETIVLWRGMKNVNCVHDAFMEHGGAEQAPMSTSRDMKVALHYGTDGQSMKGSVLFKIVARNDLEMGADIQWLSAFPQEAEVLYPPLAFLKPAKKEVLSSSGITLIEMTANLSSGLGLVGGSGSSVDTSGFTVGMEVTVMLKDQLRTGRVTNVSADDGIRIKYQNGDEDEYLPKKVRKMIELGQAETDRRAKVAKEKAAREKAAKEKAAREKTAIEKAAKEKWERERPAREKVAAKMNLSAKTTLSADEIVSF